MKLFELLPRPLGKIFRKLTHFTCNSRSVQRLPHEAIAKPNTFAQTQKI